MTSSNDSIIRERAKNRIFEKEARLKELEKDSERNLEEIEILKKELASDYELAYGRD